METVSASITKRKDGRYMGKFIVGYDDSGKTQYQYVYGKTYDEAESKVLITSILVTVVGFITQTGALISLEEIMAPIASIINK